MYIYKHVRNGRTDRAPVSIGKIIATPPWRASGGAARHIVGGDSVLELSENDECFKRYNTTLLLDEPQSFYLFHPEILSPYIKRVSLVTLQVLRHDGKASHDIPGILGRGNLDTSSAAALGRPLIPFTDFST